MANAQTATTASSNPLQRSLLLVGAGIVAIVVADYAPTLVNGVLLLILVGVFLQRTPQWQPLINGINQKLGGS